MLREAGRRILIFVALCAFLAGLTLIVVNVKAQTYFNATFTSPDGTIVVTVDGGLHAQMYCNGTKCGGWPWEYGGVGVPGLATGTFCAAGVNTCVQTYVNPDRVGRAEFVDISTLTFNTQGELDALLALNEFTINYSHNVVYPGPGTYHFGVIRDDADEQAHIIDPSRFGEPVDHLVLYDGSITINYWVYDYDGKKILVVANSASEAPARQVFVPPPPAAEFPKQCLGDVIPQGLLNGDFSVTAAHWFGGDQVDGCYWEPSSYGPVINAITKKYDASGNLVGVELRKFNCLQHRIATEMIGMDWSISRVLTFGYEEHNVGRDCPELLIGM